MGEPTPTTTATTRVRPTIRIPSDDGRDDGSSPGSPGTPDQACDGSLASEIPDGFPLLGEGCRSRFQYAWENHLFDASGEEDQVSGRGVRAFPDDISLSRYDMGVDLGDGFFTVYLFVPSLDPSIYRDEDGGFAGHWIGSSYDTFDTSISGVMVEVAGRSDAAIWGRFVAKMCDDPDIDDCFIFKAGRFSAAIDDAPSAYEFGFPPQGERDRASAVCETTSDCNVADCNVVTCDEYRCIGQPIQGACASDESCDWYEGCVPLDL